jgi:hypothetical protein
MIRMNFTLRPMRRVESWRSPWNQRRLFFLLEDIDRYSSRGSMDASSGNIAAPALCTAPDIVNIDERLPFPEALSRISHSVLDNRFIFGVMRSRCIQQEPTIVRVLQKRFIEPGRVSICRFDGGFEVVDHNPTRTASEKLKRPFKAINY